MQSKPRYVFLICTLLLPSCFGVIATAQEYPVQNRRVVWDEGWVQPGVQVQSGAQYVPGARPLMPNEVIISDIVVGRGSPIEQGQLIRTENVTGNIVNGGVLNITQDVAAKEPTLAPKPAGASLDKQLDGINEKIDEAVTNLLKAHNDTTSYDEHVKSITEQNDAIKKMLAERDVTLGKIENSLAKQSEKADANATAIGKLMTKVDGLAKRNPGQGNAQLKKQIESQSAKIDALSKKMADATQAVASSGSADEIKALSGKVDAAIQALGAGEDDGASNAVAESNAKIDAAIVELKKQVGEQSTKIDQLVTGADEQLSAQAKKIDELAKKVDAANKSIAAGGGSDAELKSLSSKVDAAIQALGAADEDSKGGADATNAVAAKVDDALKAIGENQKKLDALGKAKSADPSKGGSDAELKALSGKVDAAIQALGAADKGSTSEADRKQFKKLIADQSAKLESLAKKIDDSAKSQAKIGAGNGVLNDLKSSFSSQAKKSSDTDRKLDALMKSVDEAKHAANDRADARLKEQAEQLKRMEKLLADAKREAEKNKQRVDEMQDDAKKSEKRYQEYIAKMKASAKSRDKNEDQEREELEDELANLLKRLDKATERLDDVSERAAHLADHEAERQQAEDASHDVHNGEHGEGHEEGHEGGHGADAKDGRGDASHGDGSKDTAAGGAVSGDIDPLRKRLEEVKRRLEEAKKKK